MESVFAHYWPHLASVEIDCHALLMVCKLLEKQLRVSNKWLGWAWDGGGRGGAGSFKRGIRSHSQIVFSVK